jgi:hypothetical protein
MIAARLDPHSIAAPRTPASDAGRRRQQRTRRQGYVSAIRVAVVLAFVLTMVMAYLALMANLTSLNYRIARASAERSALSEASVRLEDRIAHLESRERLAVLAIKMGWREPHIYAVVDQPQPKQKSDGITAAARGGIALLGAVAGWLKGP